MSSATLCFSGFSRDDLAKAQQLFAQANAETGGRFALAPEGEAQVLVIDMDSMYGHMTWLKAQDGGKTTVGLTSGERCETDYLVRSPLTKLVTITGSVDAGRAVMRAAADNITVVSLELGGKAPFIVMDDAQVDLAVRMAVGSRFRNCGQVCICNERTYVHRAIYDEFVGKLVSAVGRLKVGDPMAPDTDLGPKVSRLELEKVEAAVQQALTDGAEVLLGGSRPIVPGYEQGFWYSPTVLANVRNDMAIIQHEIFGPVLPVMPFDDFDEAVHLANDSRYGLSAYLFTEDFRRVMQAVNAIDFGELYVNRIGPEAAHAFHTGYRHSGIGGEGGRYGLDSYLQKKAVYLNYAAQP